MRVVAQPLTYYPNYICTCESNPYPHSTHVHGIYPNACSKICSHVHPSNGVQPGPGKIQRSSLPKRKPQAEENPSIHNSNLYNLKLHLKPQPSRSEKTPLGLTQYQPLRTYSKPEQIGQFPLLQHPL